MFSPKNGRYTSVLFFYRIPAVGRLSPTEPGRGVSLGLYDYSFILIILEWVINCEMKQKSCSIRWTKKTFCSQ